MKKILKSDVGKRVISSSEAADLLGITRIYFDQLAARFRIKPWLTLPNARLWDRAVVLKLKDRPDRRKK